MTKRVLISGASGFVGAHLAKDFADCGYYVIAIGGSNAPAAIVRKTATAYHQGDLSNPEFPIKLIKNHKPDIVIHAAACASPAACEQNPAQAKASNLKATENIITACLNSSLSKIPRLIFFSSDMVFEGNEPKPGGFSEYDEPRPIGVYANTKLQAETSLLSSLPNSIIFRLSLVYGEKIEERGGFMDWLRTHFESEQVIPAYFDEFRTPIWVRDISLALDRFIQLLDGPQTHFEAQRIFHLGGPERLSRTAFAEKVAERFDYDSALIEPVSRLTHASGEARAADLSLNSELFWSTINSSPTLLEAALKKFVQ